MIVHKAIVVVTKETSFKNDKKENIKFFQVCAEGDSRLYLITSKKDIEVGTEISVVYDEGRKRHSLIEYA